MLVPAKLKIFFNQTQKRSEKKYANYYHFISSFIDAIIKVIVAHSTSIHSGFVKRTVNVVRVLFEFRYRKMKKIIFALSLVIASHQFVIADEVSATELISDIYKSCLSQYSTNCIKPKALAWISHAVNQDTIKITEDLSIVRTGEDEFDATARNGNAVVNLFDRLDSFLSSHSLRIEAPQILKQEEARSMVPSSLLKGGLADGLEVPLVEGNAVQGRFKF
jgi:hypothetical protein